MFHASFQRPAGGSEMCMCVYREAVEGCLDHVRLSQSPLCLDASERAGLLKHVTN